MTLKHFFLLAALAVPSIGVSSEQSLCSDTNDECVAVGQWQISLAVGGGVLTNPVVGGDNIPLLVVPYVSYYNERFFLENTTIGYTFSDAPSFDLSAILELNGEQKYFNSLHAGNIIGVESASFNDSEVLEPTSSDSESFKDILPDIRNPNAPKKLPSTDDISERDWAIDGGLLGNWYIGNAHNISAQWLYDVSGVYKGQHIKVSYKYRFQPSEQWPAKVMLSMGAHWQSDELIDYYYGIDKDDDVSRAYHYRGQQGISTFIGLALNYRLNPDWQLKFSTKRTFLANEIQNSPLITEKYQDYLFIGGQYDF